LPPADLPEVAFAGRSNVGKSSLINALTGRKALARTSRTPGRTRELNFFDLGASAGPTLRLVDMPGYGYAVVPKEVAQSWPRLISRFLRGRPSLLRVFLLIDGRHGAKATDIEMLDLLDRSALSYQIVLTKSDEVAWNEREGRASALALALKRPAAFPRLVSTSSHTGEGIEDMRATIAQLLSERRRPQSRLG